ncbi:MAG: hypothetical protein AB8G22_25585 [Saprospiraceae bacterium]
MNSLYFLYQLVAIFFLVMAGIAVANYMTFDLSHVLEQQTGVEMTGTLGNSENLYHRLRFGLLMWIGGVIIALTTAYSKKIWLGYPLIIGGLVIFFIFLAYQISGEFFAQRWVTQVFGYVRNAYLYNFILCMTASYWLFRRSAIINQIINETPQMTREDILDADL